MAIAQGLPVAGYAVPAISEEQKAAIKTALQRERTALGTTGYSLTTLGPRIASSVGRPLSDVHAVAHELYLEMVAAGSFQVQAAEAADGGLQHAAAAALHGVAVVALEGDSDMSDGDSLEGADGMVAGGQGGVVAASPASLGVAEVQGGGGVLGHVLGADVAGAAAAGAGVEVQGTGVELHWNMESDLPEAVVHECLAPVEG